MRKMILAGLAAILLGTASLASPAEARCWYNGYSWHCWHPHAWWWRHHRYWHGHSYHSYAWWRYHHPYYPYYAWRY